MKNILLLFTIFSIVLTSCGSPKQAIAEGDYDEAITDASLSLKKNPNNENQALYLHEAYTKATERDLATIEQLKNTASQNPENWVEIYTIYDKMLIREIAVLPLLPLYANGKELQFDIPNVDNEAEEAKVNASRELYNQANSLLMTGNTEDARKAYTLFDQLVEFNFNYRDAREKREEAKLKGSTNVLVQMNNQTGQQLPSTFEDDLLTFREGSFSDEWILYSSERKPGIVYNYEVDLNITQLIVGRAQEQQQQYREQARVIVGYRQGKDSKGNTVRVPQYGTVYADVLETRQYKPIRVAGSVTYKELPGGKELANLPVEREEAWQNVYAQFRGDERALTQETIQKIQNGPQQVPSDAEFFEISGKLLNQVVVQLFEENAKNLK